MKFPRRNSRANNIIATLDDVHRDVSQLAGLLENEAVFKKDSIDKVMTFNA